MPSLALRLYSVLFKFHLHRNLQTLAQSNYSSSYGVVLRPDENIAPSNPSFSQDGVATKDIHIDPNSSLSIRIFLPISVLNSPNSPNPNFNSPIKNPNSASNYPNSTTNSSNSAINSSNSATNYPNSAINSSNSAINYPNSVINSSNSATNYPNSVINNPNLGINNPNLGFNNSNLGFNNSNLGINNPNLGINNSNLGFNNSNLGVNDHKLGVNESNLGYGGYVPEKDWRRGRKVAVIVQFHGGGWVRGGKDTVENDGFCRRVAKMCDAMVVAVGYRLAPESRYPGAFEDGVKVLNWLKKQLNLAECSRGWVGGGEGGGKRRQIVDGFGGELVEPWLAAHADLSRCVLLGVSCGANIANFVAQNAVVAGKHLDPVKVVAQVLMYPFFIGSTPTRSEIKLANSYIYDKALSIMAWKLFLPEKDFTLDHPAANPLLIERDVPLKKMPPTLTVIAEHDWMRDRAIAYSEELRKVNVDSPHLDYKDTVHDFATLEMLLKTPQAKACTEDIAIWVKKYISLRGNEFSY